MNLILAPMHGMTNAFYRNTYNKTFGNIDTYYAPFISTSNMCKASSLVFNDIRPDFNTPGLQLVPQLLSNRGADFNFYASIIHDLGYNEINWNIGCPFHKVARKQRGSGILPYPDLIKGFLDDVCHQQKYDLSIKMRLGLENKDEGLEVIKLFNDYPIKNITIHGRVGKQIYTGRVDLDAFEELYSASKHKIIYNGDIYSVKDYHTISKKFPNIQDFMMGRGALNNPFLASTIKGIQLTSNEKLNKLIAFHQDMFNYYTSILDSELRHLSKMKEFWSYLGLGLDPSGNFVSELKRCMTMKDYQLLIDFTFSHYDDWIHHF